MLKYETKWKWTDTPDSWRGQSGNGQTLQTVEGDKVEMDRHSRQSKGTKLKWTDTQLLWSYAPEMNLKYKSTKGNNSSPKRFDKKTYEGGQIVHCNCFDAIKVLFNLINRIDCPCKALLPQFGSILLLYSLILQHSH